MFWHEMYVLGHERLCRSRHRDDIIKKINDTWSRMKEIVFWHIASIREILS